MMQTQATFHFDVLFTAYDRYTLSLVLHFGYPSIRSTEQIAGDCQLERAAHTSLSAYHSKHPPIISSSQLTSSCAIAWTTNSALITRKWPPLFYLQNFVVLSWLTCRSARSQVVKFDPYFAVSVLLSVLILRDTPGHVTLTRTPRRWHLGWRLRETSGHFHCFCRKL